VPVDPMKPKLTAREIKLLKLKCDELLSTSGYHFNSRRYSEATCYAAEIGKYRGVLRWAREHGCPCPEHLMSL